MKMRVAGVIRDSFRSVGALLVFLAVLGCGVISGCRRGDLPRSDSSSAGTKPGQVVNSPRGDFTLVVGSISPNPGDEMRDFLPFKHILENTLGIPVSLVMESTIDAMARKLTDGSVHLLLDSPLPALEVCRRSKSVPVFLWKKHGLSEYYSIIFSRKDSGISTIGDLRGHTIVLSTPYSTSGYGLPKSYLESFGIKLTRPGEPNDPEGVEIVFSGDAENTMFWVLENKGDAGAVANEYYLSLAGIRVDELKILGKTPPIPRGLVCIGPGTPEDLVPRIKKILGTLETDESFREELRSFKGTVGFESLDEEHVEKIASALGFGKCG